MSFETQSGQRMPDKRRISPIRHIARLVSRAFTGLVLFACGQIIWGAWAATVDVWLAAASIVMGLAALSWVHIMPRLRHLLVE